MCFSMELTVATSGMSFSNLNGLNGFLVDFPGGNSAVFSNNSSTNNTLLVYNIISGTPFDGIMTNTGSGNGGGGDNF